MTENLNEFTKKELIDMITFIKDLREKEKLVEPNRIECLGISVSSPIHSLKEVEKVFDSVLQKHKDFIKNRRNDLNRRGYLG